MGEIGDLVRAIRARGGAADPLAVRAALDRAASQEHGRYASRSEVIEVRRLLEAPELRDRFHPDVRRSLESFVNGDTGASRPRSIEELVPDMERMQHARDVPGRFGADLVLLQEQLLGLRGLTSLDRAMRLFEFFARYAERFLELAGDRPGDANDPAQRQVELGIKLAPGEREALVGEFLARLREHGYQQLVEAGSERSAVEVAREILLGKRRLDEVSRGFRPLAAALPVEGPPPELAAPAASAVPTHELPPRPMPQQEPRPAGNKPRRRGALARLTDRVLGPKLLWNVLHVFRRQDEEATAEDQMDRILVVSALFLFGLVIAVAILVNL